MSDSDPRPLSPEEERALTQAIWSLSGERPDPAFRARLRERFVSGGIAADAGDERPARPPSRALDPPARRGMLLALAAAASVALALAAAWAVRPMAWSLHASDASAVVQVDGREVAVGDARALEKVLAAGGAITAPGAVPIELRMGDAVRIQLAPGTSAHVPPPARRLFAGRIETHLVSGEMCVATLAGFPRAGLLVTTDEGRVEVSGTVFSVVRDDAVTCVCVMAGTVHVGRDVDRLEAIGAGFRKTMFRDGRESVTGESMPAHREALERFQPSDSQ